MKSIKLHFFRYVLPLRRPIAVTGQRINRREGLLIEAVDNQGRTGWGEAAPLPGLHRETLPEVIEAVRQSPLTPEIGHPTGGSPAVFLRELAGQIPADWTPSHRFGVSTALTMLYAAQNGKSLASFLNPAAPDTVLINAMLDSSPEQLEQRVQEILRRGFRCIKIKVGRGSVGEDLRRLEQIAGYLPETVQLRPDANRAWSVAEALEFAEGVKGLPIEYLEEPLRDSASLPDFARKSGLPAALDETVAEAGADYPIFPGLAAIIVKPSLMGDLSELNRLLQPARAQGVKIIFSNAFESGLGHLVCASLAAAWGNRNTAHGLDTWQQLESDLLVPPFQTQGDRINLRRFPAGELEIDSAFLSPL